MSAHWHISSRQWAICEKIIVNIWHIAKHCVSLHSQTRKDDHSLHGEMAEWSNAPVLKTGVLQGTGGSNPSLSAKISVTSCKTTSYADFSFKGAPNLRQNFSDTSNPQLNLSTSFLRVHILSLLKLQMIWTETPTCGLQYPLTPQCDLRQYAVSYP